MARKSFATLVVSLLIALSTSVSQARSKDVAVDGCAMLARAIYTEVSSSAIHGPGNAGPWLIDQGRGDVVLCKHAAKTVSQAFTSAMSSAGIDVGWKRSRVDEIENGSGHCLRAFLSQCYPDRNPPSKSRANAFVVENTWAIVRQAVMREMYNPASSDQVSFRANDLKLRLGLSLRSIEGRNGR